MTQRSLLGGVIVVVAAAGSMGSSCLGTKDIAHSVDDATAAATKAISDAIATISGSLGDWKSTLEDLESKLASDAQATIRNEVASVLENSIAVANASAECTFDFIGHRVVQSLERIKAKLLGGPGPTLTPETCSVAPPGFEFADWQAGHVPTVQYYGYDLDAPLGLALETKTGVVDVSQFLSKVSDYQVAVNLGSNGVPLTPESNALVLGNPADPDHPVSRIPVVQPTTPLCETRTSAAFEPAPISFRPPWTSGVDSDFSGHGPLMTANLSTFIVNGVLKYVLYVDARETESNYTEIEGQTIGTAYTPEPGWAVDAMVGVTTSETTTTDHDRNHEEALSPGQGPVQTFTFYGDYDGSDEGRTGVDVKWNLIKVELIQTKDCLPAKTARKMIDAGKLSPANTDRLKPSLPPSP